MFLAKTKRKSKSMNGIGEIIDISKIFTSIAKKKKKKENLKSNSSHNLDFTCQLPTKNKPRIIFLKYHS